MKGCIFFHCVWVIFHELAISKPTVLTESSLHYGYSQCKKKKDAKKKKTDSTHRSLLSFYNDIFGLFTYLLYLSITNRKYLEDDLAIMHYLQILFRSRLMERSTCTVKNVQVKS